MGPGSAGHQGHIYKSGHDHAADGRGDGQRGTAPRGQVADGEFAFYLEANDEKKYREQGVVDPVGQRQSEGRVAERQTEFGFPETRERRASIRSS